VLSSDFQANPLNRGAAVTFTLLGPGASISIGNDCGLSSCSIVANSTVIIGNEVLVGAGVVITDTDFHKVNSRNRRYDQDQTDIDCKPVYIGDNVWLGADVKILKGVTIGRNSVVAAGAIVTENVACDTLVAGIPARLIKNIDVL
jgi:acetyltransferase-like isoleucine patch superfamily enzyme